MMRLFERGEWRSLLKGKDSDLGGKKQFSVARLNFRERHHMGAGNMKPIILLAYANDRDDHVHYLRNLSEEARRLQKILGQAARDGLCELLVRQNATLDDILDVFQVATYRNRIAIFHYGGHANGYQLLFESTSGQPAPA